MAMPSERESTTVTGTGACWAARWADSMVEDMSAEMWIDTTASAPSAAAFSYVSRNACGVGRDVETGLKDRNAAATCSVLTSTPSLYSVPAMMTWSGTT